VPILDHLCFGVVRLDHALGNGPHFVDYPVVGVELEFQGLPSCVHRKSG
jgi:hypothetical protein